MTTQVTSKLPNRIKLKPSDYNKCSRFNFSTSAAKKTKQFQKIDTLPEKQNLHKYISFALLTLSISFSLISLVIVFIPSNLLDTKMAKADTKIDSRPTIITDFTGCNNCNIKTNNIKAANNTK